MFPVKDSPKHTLVLDRDAAVAPLIAEWTGWRSFGFVAPQDVVARRTALDPDPVALFVDAESLAFPQGAGVIPLFRVLWPRAVIFLMTAHGQGVGRLLASGAHDFLTKPLSRDVLVERVGARVFEMELRAAEDGDAVALGKGKFSFRKRYLDGPRRKVSLSPLQAELLQVLSESEGALIPKDVLKRAVWGSIAITDNAIDRRLSELRKIFQESGVDMGLVSEYGRGISLQRQSVAPLSNKKLA